MTRAAGSPAMELSGLFLVAVSVAVLVGCAGASEPATVLPIGLSATSGSVAENAELKLADRGAGDIDFDDSDDTDRGDRAALFDTVDSDDTGTNMAVLYDPDESSDSGDTDADGEMADTGSDASSGADADIDDYVDDTDDGGDGDDADVDDDGKASGVRFVVDGFGGVLVEGPCGWDGPVCPPAEGVAPIDAGGRLVLDRSVGDWGPWVGRVLDMCDDHEANVALNGNFRSEYDNGIDYSALLSSLDVESIRKERERRPIVCSDAEAAIPRWKCWEDDFEEFWAYMDGFDEPPEHAEVSAQVESSGWECWDAAAQRLRYVYVTRDGPLMPQSSVEAAVDDYLAEVARYGGSVIGENLGYRAWTWGGILSADSPADPVFVLPATVSVTDGVLRGLAWNGSERLWARNVTLTATDPTGGAGEWRYPLTVQPLESMPFKIETWAGTQTPSDIEFTITADLSPTIDLTRSLELSRYEYSDYTETYLYYHDYPEEMGAYPYGSSVLESPDGYLDWFQVNVSRSESTAHPLLAEAARQQTIENLTVYAAILKDGTVVEEVWELTPMTRSPGEWIGEGDEEEWIPGDWIEMRTIPTELPDDPLPRDYAIVGIVGHTDIYLWAGGVAEDPLPLDDEPQ